MAVVECSEHRGEKKLVAIEGAVRGPEPTVTKRLELQSGLEGSGMDGPRSHAIGGVGGIPVPSSAGPGEGARARTRQRVALCFGLWSHVIPSRPFQPFDVCDLFSRHVPTEGTQTYRTDPSKS